MVFFSKMLNRYKRLKEFSQQSKRSMFYLFCDYYKLKKEKGIYFEEYKQFLGENPDPIYRDSFLGLNEQIVYLDKLNPIKYYSLARNKYVAHCVLESLGVKMPRLLGYYHPATAFCNSGNHFSNIRQIINGLKQNGTHNIVIKTTESSHGDGVWVVDKIDYEECNVTFDLVNKKKIELSEILAIKEPFLIEERIKQTIQFEQFNSTSVNTLRIMTVLNPDGKAKIVGVFIRIGRNGAFIDNAGNGGNIDANVNIETGTLERVVEFRGFNDLKYITTHPDSGHQLEGVRIENWDLIKSTIIEYQESCPFLKAIGWDVAITNDGPVVIEINDFWDRAGQLFIGKGWRNEIRNCYMAWNKSEYNPVVERCSMSVLSPKFIHHIIE